MLERYLPRPSVDPLSEARLTIDEVSKVLGIFKDRVPLVCWRAGILASPDATYSYTEVMALRQAWDEGRAEDTMSVREAAPLFGLSEERTRRALLELGIRPVSLTERPQLYRASEVAFAVTHWRDHKRRSRNQRQWQAQLLVAERNLEVAGADALYRSQYEYLQREQTAVPMCRRLEPVVEAHEARMTEIMSRYRDTYVPGFGRFYGV